MSQEFKRIQLTFGDREYKLRATPTTNLGEFVTTVSRVPGQTPFFLDEEGYLRNVTWMDVSDGDSYSLIYFPPRTHEPILPDTHPSQLSVPDGQHNSPAQTPPDAAGHCASKRLKIVPTSCDKFSDLGKPWFPNRLYPTALVKVEPPSSVEAGKRGLKQTTVGSPVLPVCPSTTEKAAIADLCVKVRDAIDKTLERAGVDGNFEPVSLKSSEQSTERGIAQNDKYPPTADGGSEACSNGKDTSPQPIFHKEPIVSHCSPLNAAEQEAAHVSSISLPSPPRVVRPSDATKISHNHSQETSSHDIRAHVRNRLHAEVPEKDGLENGVIRTPSQDNASSGTHSTEETAKISIRHQISHVLTSPQERGNTLVVEPTSAEVATGWKNRSTKKRAVDARARRIAKISEERQARMLARQEINTQMFDEHGINIPCGPTSSRETFFSVEKTAQEKLVRGKVYPKSQKDNQSQPLEALLKSLIPLVNPTRPQIQMQASHPPSNENAQTNATTRTKSPDQCNTSAGEKTRHGDSPRNTEEPLDTPTVQISC